LVVVEGVGFTLQCPWVEQVSAAAQELTVHLSVQLEAWPQTVPPVQSVSEPQADFATHAPPVEHLSVVPHCESAVQALPQVPLGKHRPEGPQSVEALQPAAGALGLLLPFAPEPVED
jgi:hypothetical protein